MVRKAPRRDDAVGGEPPETVLAIGMSSRVELEREKPALAVGGDAQRQPVCDPARGDADRPLALQLVGEVAADLGEGDAARFAVIAIVVPVEAEAAVD